MSWYNVQMCRNPSLGLTTEVKGLQECGLRGKPGNHIPYYRKCKRVREWTLTLLRELPFWELAFRWTSKSSKSNCKGQNSLDWGVPYIIEKILERRCLNGLLWPIWTSKTQVMVKRRAGSQIANLTPDHKKLGIDPIYLRAGGVPHTVEKLSMRATTLL
jgi:hypothetical protein